MTKSNPELLEKLQTETKRLAAGGEKDIRKISAEAIKAVYGADLTDEELDQVVNTAAKATTELNLDEMANVAGGRDFDDYVVPSVTMFATTGALAGGGAGTAFPLIGNAVGLVAGTAIGAVIGFAVGSVSYVKNEL